MSASDLADVLGVMAIATVLAGAVLAVAVATPSSRPRALAVAAEHGRISALVVAVVAMGSSLWFSEIADFPPCELCWYQRIAIYPLVAVLGVRALTTDRAAATALRHVALVLVGAGILVNGWHVAIETHPAWSSGSCSATVPCTVRWVEGLGFFTIPRLATVVLWAVAATLLVELVPRSDGDPS